MRCIAAWNIMQTRTRALRISIQMLTYARQNTQPILKELTKAVKKIIIM